MHKDTIRLDATMREALRPRLALNLLRQTHELVHFEFLSTSIMVIYAEKQGAHIYVYLLQQRASSRKLLKTL